MSSSPLDPSLIHTSAQSGSAALTDTCLRRLHRAANHASLRVGYLDPHPLPARTPSALQTLNTVDALARIGLDIQLISGPNSWMESPTRLLGRDVHRDVRMTRVPLWWDRWPLLAKSRRAFALWANAFLSGSDLDLVYTRNLKLADRLIRSGCPLPIVFEAHEIHHWTRADDLTHPASDAEIQAVKAMERRVYQNLAGLVAISTPLLADLRRSFRVIAPASVAQDGVDLDAAAATRRARLQRSAHNVATKAQAGAQAPTVLLYLGSLHPWKGLETAIHAMRHVDQAVLKIAGGHDQRIKHLRDLARSQGVAHKVDFLGHVAYEHRYELLRDADIGLLPLSDTRIAQRHTSPLKLFEYAAAGLPMITGRAASTTSLIQHDVHALMHEVGHAEGLAQCVKQLQADPARAHRLADTAYDWVKHHDWQHRAAKIAGVLERAARQQARLARLQTREAWATEIAKA